ncbi:hydrogenase maturation nickel metallochaperone HypA [Caloramator quimbayensis]|uniref:hydrogenase maturation nickel metallochaperone HypA n=1 Tax=Caloramator quimbayensis TaxID=1147123 RepID=UPI0015C46918|nr:hydrogenase maturation nickel metallochaperone HypA [Caloramator quimbayensis]
MTRVFPVQIDDMHELSIIEGIIKITEEEVKKYEVNRIIQIRLKVGIISGIMPSLLQEYFSIASKGTVVEGAVLKIETVPLRIKCLNCECENIMENIKIKCPICKSSDLKILSGRELYIDSLEVE